MSYKERLSDLDRQAEASLTEQIDAIVREAVAEDELRPGEQLPPTRELAEIAGVNHLTAVRAYRRLREAGVVTAQVGRGTFVRETAAAAPALAPAGGTGWQAFALPEREDLYGDRVVFEMFRQVGDPADVIPLSVGFPSRDLYPREAIAQAAAAVAGSPERILDYADIPGAPELREELAKLMQRRGVPDQADDLVIVNGARQGLTVASRAILPQGATVACEVPTFWGLLTSLRQVGNRILPVPVDRDGFDVDAFEALLARHEISAVLLQPRAHNPTGHDLSPERRGRLIELARRHSLFIIEDGIYGELRFDGDPLPPLRAEAPEHVVYIDSLSKTLGGGLRVGWIASSGPVRERLLDEKQRDDIHTPTMTQLTAARFLESGAYDDLLAEARPFYRRRCEVLLEALDEHLGDLATFSEPTGGGHVCVTLDALLDEGELATEAVRNGVTFVPGATLMPDHPLRTMMRVSFCWLSPDDLAEGARRLGQAVHAAIRRPQAARARPIA